MIIDPVTSPKNQKKSQISNVNQFSRYICDHYSGGGEKLDCVVIRVDGPIDPNISLLNPKCQISDINKFSQYISDHFV